MYATPLHYYMYTSQEMREVHGYGDSGEDYTEAVEACMNGGPIDHVRVWLKDTLAIGSCAA
jgi:hypothetical protein